MTQSDNHEDRMVRRTPEDIERVRAATTASAEREVAGLIARINDLDDVLLELVYSAELTLAYGEEAHPRLQQALRHLSEAAPDARLKLHGGK